ncbi:EF-hand domain-containing family member C2 [Eupeodes corollae]|uniref:EF-hand domain-containing family member C2 n=1 Tax=Eupeodes corollae TaxID=290404 RepID=UPI0024922C4B|nr:EF-hand domain-containing family member C2 [Eupeodes corollae]
MLRIPGMPLLPGTQFRDLTKSNFAKSQSLLNYYGIGMLSDREVPKLVDPRGMIVDPNCPPPEIPSIDLPKAGPKLPTWVAYDKQVLCFDGYFKETLQEVYHAPYLVRKVKICYFLEDDTIQVTEPKVENSGITQGCLVHKQRVPKPAPCENECISILDLNVNTNIQIFDRVYHITGCDLFTRHFLNRAGIPVPDPVDMPLDPTIEHRKRSVIKHSAPTNRKHAFAQFLQFDRKVLRFKCYWDDRSEFGDVRNLELCYYLSDDTMDIKEIFPVNSGRDGPTTFLKRGKLPKDGQGLHLPGEQTEMTILNVLGGGLRTGRYITDILGTGKKDFAFYTDKDLQIGVVLNVYGRNVVLTSCDSFTMEYYRKKYGLEDFSPLPLPNHYEDQIAQRMRERQLPPYNGWGSYEDSEGNCISVEPKPPQGDFKKFVTLDKFILRFGAKMISTIRENCERVFVVSYYLSDDTIQIFEVAERNSGFLGGTFLKRGRILLPNQEKFSCKRPEYYRPHHLYIGATVNLKDHIFSLVSADEYTLIYMESHPFEFPLADVQIIMHKIREALRHNYKNFIEKHLPEGFSESETKLISYETLKKNLIELLGNNITDQEIITLCRFYSAEQKPPSSCNRETVRSAIHLEIRRNLWDDMDHLKEHVHHINPSHKSFISESTLRSIITGCRLPFTTELIDDMFKVLNHNDMGEIEVCDFMSFVDVSCNPASDIPPINYAFELCPKIPFLHKGRLVNWDCFVQHLGLEKELIEESN